MSARTHRRWLIASGLAVIVAAAAVVSATALAAPPAGEPSLAVFDREPTDREREVEALSERDGGGVGWGDAEVQARLILEYEAEPESPAREVWALRFMADGPAGGQLSVVCLSSEPAGVDGGPFACMEEPDLARRGFIPLDQPRPSVVVGGEVRVIEWGPTGDARLIDPPEPPAPDDERS